MSSPLPKPYNVSADKFDIQSFVLNPGRSGYVGGYDIKSAVTAVHNRLRRDIIPKGLPNVDPDRMQCLELQTVDHHNVMLRPAQTRVAANKKTYTELECSMGQECVSLQIKGTCGLILRSALSNIEEEHAVMQGIVPSVASECVLCVRYHLTKEGILRELHQCDGSGISQPYRVTIDANNPQAYRGEYCYTLVNEHSKQWTGFIAPFVKLVPELLKWVHTGGQYYVDQSLMTYRAK